MPRLIQLTEYRDHPDGEPDFSYIKKAIVFGLRQGSKLVLVPDIEGLRVALDAATGLVPTGLTLPLLGVRALRDHLIRLCDQLSDERYPR